MKIRYILVICVVLVFTLLTACGRAIPPPDANSSGSAGSPYQKITAANGKSLLDNGNALTLLDVRRADEYETAHIPSAINLPNESINTVRPDVLPDLDKTIVVYCRTGVRSKDAADKLVKMGYTDVRDMGGITDWPYDTVTGTEPGEYIKNDTAPAGIMSSFTAKDLDGNDVNQSIFTGYDLTMVNVWATYCGPCLSEMPELGELADEYRNKGVRIVGMVTDVLNFDGSVSNSQIETAQSIVSRTGADYIHIIPSNDLYGLLSRITAVPTTIFVDADGVQVGNAYIGSRSKTEWNKIIMQLLEESQK